jgi:hypothetical protein
MTTSNAELGTLNRVKTSLNIIDCTPEKIQTFQIESRVLKSNKLNTHGPIQVDMDEVKLRNGFVPLDWRNGVGGRGAVVRRTNLTGAKSVRNPFRCRRNGMERVRTSA